MAFSCSAIKTQASGGLQITVEAFGFTGAATTISVDDITVGPAGLDAHRIFYITITLDGTSYAMEVRMRDEAYEPSSPKTDAADRRGYLRRQ